MVRTTCPSKVRREYFSSPTLTSEKATSLEFIPSTMYNFSWNLDRTIWEGKNVEAQIMESGNAVGLAPIDATSDSVRRTSEHRAALLDSDSLFANLMLGAIDGRVNVITEDGKTVPVEVTDVPKSVKDAVEAKDLDKAFALLLAESAR